MDNFVKILALFKSNEERSVSRLEKVYQDDELLKKSIYSLLANELIDSGVIAGKRVLLKPNWVLHNRKPTDEVSMRTHPSVILALLEIILKQKPASVVIGDAPVQGCNWEQAVTGDFYKKVFEFSTNYSIPVEIKDFRRVTFNPDKNNPVKERNPLSSYLIFDIAGKSYLEPISVDKGNIFRVTNYDPDRLAESHTKGKHKYCITREVFDSDIVISLPKIKTHQKSGITAALKNIVGVNGDKDYLPHHRLGGTGFGGDCYPGKNYLRFWAELSLDQANRNQGKPIYWFWSNLAAVSWKLSRPKRVHHIAAAWYGNDTTWRMVMDLNQIVLFGKADGSLSDKQQRKLFSIGDGIIGGQGDGPLRPLPLPLGILTFTDNSALHDLAMGRIMRFDTEKIPLLRAASKQIKPEEMNIFVDGKESSFDALSGISLKTLPPPGWVDYLKL